MYCCHNSDSRIRKEYAGKEFALKTGWQKAGIDLYNRLYKDVQLDCNENGAEFDENFWTFYDNKTKALSKVGKKPKEKQNLPQAFNGL